MKLSVIIPVFNSEKYIEECLKSLLRQKLSDSEYEILCIDDGSTDHSGSILEAYEKKYRQIRVFRQENRGVSAARNKGLQEARGEYLSFVDGDDFLAEGVLAGLYEMAAGRELDQLMYGYQVFEDDVKETERKYTENIFLFENGLEMEKSRVAPEWKVVWNYLVRRRVLEKYGLRFVEGVVVSEDEEFNFWLKHCTGSCGYVDEKLYYYRRHPASSLHTFRDSLHFERYIRGRLELAVHYQKILEKYAEGKQPELLLPVTEEEVKNRMYCGIRGTLNRLAVRGDPGLMELTLRFLENRGLYPYPLRLYRRDGRYTFQHFLADCLSFFYPKKRYLRFCIALRSLFIKRQGDVGILTFHCADNYGALLQACSLRRCICSLGRKADIVRYEPAAVAGGFRWIPYIPGGSRKSVLGRAIRGFRYNLGKAPDFFRRRRCMNQFRNCFLTEGFGFRLRFPGQWKRLPYRDYVIGSDQVWNPQLTGGLQEAYFGFFKNPKKERVISYAASLGSSELASEYNDVFQRLIQNLDRVSLREKEAAGYVSRFFRGPVEICMDPVFLQDRSFWEGLERRPDREQYILVYNVDGNRRLYEYAGELSCKLGLPVVELGLGVWQKPVFWMDYQAGPQEFLGYIHHAECVVTNSFHGIAFSIIFEKRFIGFLHETRGERTRNILKICGLEDRLYEERGGDVYGRGEICWEDVRRRTAEAVRHSKIYLEILKEEDEKE